MNRVQAEEEKSHRRREERSLTDHKPDPRSKFIVVNSVVKAFQDIDNGTIRDRSRQRREEREEPEHSRARRDEQRRPHLERSRATRLRRAAPAPARRPVRAARRLRTALPASTPTRRAAARHCCDKNIIASVHNL